MARRGRKPHADPPVEWKISIPQSVAAPVELLLTDAFTGKPKHGARAKLITELLTNWLEEQRKP
jgi:hypothetical protein